MARRLIRGRLGQGPPHAAVKADLDFLIWSAGLASVRRYHNQPFWEREGQASDAAWRIEDGLRLESVAEHSWKVADAVSILVSHYSRLNAARCVQLALIHDKLELITGDASPIDADASGTSTHAFNATRAKADLERSALPDLVRRLRPELREVQKALFYEVIDKRTPEANFVAAVDKLISVMYVMDKKEHLAPAHLEFTIKYVRKSVALFPGIRPYCEELVRRLVVKYELVAVDTRPA